MDAVQTPMLWLSYPRENNFSLDSQAATYLKAPGPRMVSLVPGMGHGHGPGWRRPESYAFADTMVAAGRPWAVQRELESMNGSARWVLESERPLDRATLIYATDFGYTGDFDWVEIPVASFEEGPAGTWAARVELPEETTGWFFNAYTAAEGPELVVSSDYQEMITVMPFPDGRIELNHPAGIDPNGQIEMGFTGPSFVEIVAVDVVESSHPGALLPYRSNSPSSFLTLCPVPPGCVSPLTTPSRNLTLVKWHPVFSAFNGHLWTAVYTP